ALHAACPVGGRAVGGRGAPDSGAGAALSLLACPSRPPPRKLSLSMGISQPQNLRIPPIEKLRPFGIRVSLPPGDPFRKLLGPEWQRLHWYSTPAERDAAMAEMSRRHEYSRAG